MPNWPTTQARTSPPPAMYQFANLTATGDLTVQGNTTIGNNASLRPLNRYLTTHRYQCTGLQGATDNTHTTFAIADPTVNRTITNATGTVCLAGNCAGTGGNGDILQVVILLAVTSSLGQTMPLA
ncbi:MAG: hypothetical protein R3B12_01070 [Candidatus Saccharimonadales bacterium]